MTRYSNNKKTFITFFSCFLFIFNISSQNYGNPLDIPLVLSANCGELRNNHFHAGIDLKTQMVENKSVYAIADGYVSRVSVSPSGYGLAVYIDHPATGHTSVYGHLNTFAPKIADYVKQQQYIKESFKVDLKLRPDQFPVKKGEFIALSGNTGGSAGPHVHFEIRDTQTQNLIDPLKFYKGMIKDNVGPEVRGIAVYPQAGKGVVNGSRSPLRISLSKNKKGVYLPVKQEITAWGTIALGIKAYDRMTGVSNIYGVKKVKLFVDNKEIFYSDIETFAHNQTRMINSFADFPAWRNNKDWFMRSLIDPGNALPFYPHPENKGWVDIKEERVYNFRYELTDIYNNSISYEIKVQGKKQNIPAEPKYSLFMPWNQNNRYINNSFSLLIDKDNLYSDTRFVSNISPSDTYLSDRYQIHNEPVPLHNNATLKIKVNVDTLSNKSQYGIVQVRKNKDGWFGGTYANGYVTTSIYELGNEYAVYFDNEPPAIEPVNQERWLRQNVIKIRLTDNISGIASFRGTIDGKFVLFTHDIKSPVYTYVFDDSRMEKGKNHLLVFTARDACGNMAEYTYELYY